MIFMTRPVPAQHSPRAFSLLEILVVLSIVALLAATLAPEAGRLMEKSRSSACLGNLRSLGVALNLYLADHDGTFPFINNPGQEVYTEENVPEGVEPVTLLQAFGPYGIDERVLRCPSDVAFNNRFRTTGTSYEWRPMLDGETSVNPQIYSRRGVFTLRRLSRFRILMDIDPVHFGRQNRLYADGSSRAFTQ